MQDTVWQPWFCFFDRSVPGRKRGKEITEVKDA